MILIITQLAVYIYIYHRSHQLFLKPGNSIDGNVYETKMPRKVEGPGGWRDFFWLEAVGKILIPTKGQRWPYDIYDTVD